MSEELRPCPFCGGEPEVSYGKGKCRVSCTKCIAMVAYYADNTYAEYEIEAKAIAMWNGRANPYQWVIGTCCPTPDNYNKLADFFGWPRFLEG